MNIDRHDITRLFLDWAALAGMVTVAAIPLSVGIAAVLAWPLGWAWNELVPLVPQLPVIGWKHAFAFYVLMTCAKPACAGLKLSAKTSQSS